jgi:hypothetical protein
LPKTVNRAVTVPPYRTMWPVTIPTARELAVYGEWPNDLRDHSDPKWALSHLYHWIMDTNHGPNDWVIYQLRPKCRNFASVAPEDLGVHDLTPENSEPASVTSKQFDAQLAQRWIMNRVLELGWTSERFGTFEELVEESVPYSRSNVSKPERMGKKYAWIAMHEFLGYLSDHVCFRGDNLRDEQGTYYGPWQLRLRDIDPSLLVKGTFRTDHSEPIKSWWQPLEVHFVEQPREIYQQWVKECSDLPDPLTLIRVHDTEKQEWLNLDSFLSWNEEIPLGEERFENPRRNLRITIKSFVVRATDSAHLASWIDGRPLRAKAMPELDGLRDVFLGEYPWALSAKPYADGQGWTTGYDNQLPSPVVVTAIDYLEEPTGYDCSIDAAVLALLPSPWLVENMRLDWSRDGFSFVDCIGDKVAFDPSEKEKGPGALLFRKDAVSTYLKEAKCDLLWTVLMERAVQHSVVQPLPGPYEGRMSRQVTCILHDGVLRTSTLRDDFEP